MLVESTVIVARTGVITMRAKPPKLGWVTFRCSRPWEGLILSVRCRLGELAPHTTCVEASPLGEHAVVTRAGGLALDAADTHYLAPLRPASTVQAGAECVTL